MQLVTHRIKECEIAEIIGDECLINNEQEAIDLISAMYYKGFDIVILKEQHINPQFYDLSTKLFGEMAQKFSNFRLRVAIIGDFENGIFQTVCLGTK
jgi:hypothetical protein